jgi:hypothetical protein
MYPADAFFIVFAIFLRDISRKIAIFGISSSCGSVFPFSQFNKVNGVTPSYFAASFFERFSSGYPFLICSARLIAAKHIARRCNIWGLISGLSAV